MLLRNIFYYFFFVILVIVFSSVAAMHQNSYTGLSTHSRLVFQEEFLKIIDTSDIFISRLATSVIVSAQKDDISLFRDSVWKYKIALSEINLNNFNQIELKNLEKSLVNYLELFANLNEYSIYFSGELVGVIESTLSTRLKILALLYEKNPEQTQEISKNSLNKLSEYFPEQQYDIISHKLNCLKETENFPEELIITFDDLESSNNIVITIH